MRCRRMLTRARAGLSPGSALFRASLRMDMISTPESSTSLMRGGALGACYDPYHQALSSLINAARLQFGCAIIVDCHSMPSAGGAPFREGEPQIDFVLGDRFGSSCAPSVTHFAEETLCGQDYEVARNAPYAGGFVASSYGRPKNGVHVLQIEINRALYLDERSDRADRRI